MSRDEFEGKWHQIKGKIREKWGKLTDDDIARIEGKFEQFLGKLQKKYGYTREQAEREAQSWKFENRKEGRSEEGESWSEEKNTEEERPREENKQKNWKEQKKHPSNCGCDSCKNKQNEKNKFNDTDYRDKKRKAG
jgi:uncharacterized protein YjbJ (UPF0337 family)